MPDNISDNLRAALYARVSSEEQREGQTIDSQIEELKRFAQQKGWHIFHVYKDAGWSGSILARPELDQLRDDASKGLFDTVLINDVDRLARDVTHLGVIKRDLERHGVKVIFKKLPAESSPTHNLMVNILGSFAEFEREMISDRTRRGRRHKVEVRQQFLGCNPAYGFHYIPKDRLSGKEGRLEIVPGEAAVVRNMYRWIDEEGLSARRVVNRLNELKIQPRNGGNVWQNSSVRRILRSEIYAGVWHYNKHESCEPLNASRKQRYNRSPKNSRRIRPKGEWIPVILPTELSIIDRAQWERVQKQLDRNIAFSPRNSKHTYLLKGLVVCGGCFSRYVGDPCHGKFYYRCLARCKKLPTIRDDGLNEVVWTAVVDMVLNPRSIEDQIDKLNQKRNLTVDQSEKDALELQNSLQQVEVEEARVMEAYRTGILSQQLLSGELSKLAERRTSIETQKRKLEVKKQVPVQAIKRSFREYFDAVARRLERFTFEEKQRLLRILIRTIVFQGNKVIIRGMIPVSAIQNTGLNQLHGQYHPVEVYEDPGQTASIQINLNGHNSTTEFKHFLEKRPDEPVDYFEFTIDKPIITKSTKL